MITDTRAFLVVAVDFAAAQRSVALQAVAGLGAAIAAVSTTLYVLLLPYLVKVGRVASLLLASPSRDSKASHRSDKLDDQNRQAAEVIHRNGEYRTALVARLAQVAQAQRASLPVDLQVVELGPSFKQVLKQRRDDRIEVFVTDHGDGVPPSLTFRMFADVAQAGSSVSDGRC